MNCSQCGKTAINQVEGQPLCVDCYLKLQQAIQMQNNRYLEEMNYLSDMMEATLGVYGVLPKYKINQPNQYINTGKISFNNINVDRSVIGAINPGEVKKIDVAMEQIKKSGNDELVAALKDFTEKIIESNELKQEEKNELLEQVSFIASQTALPKEKQKKSIVKPIMNNIKEIVSTIGTLYNLWEKVKPFLDNIFS
ncbi:hypothetical protein [Halothermothrix orenii]|uniref:Uncharacterized protein n=1 Tax=Halothermothrix orenii (strain H 168 / OCM 544 / DSM 9562) TaxID=373903 RepID=B8D029_HALOH|nr:hypothetical protein [Halothermothrix orenii]ACL68783.1 hypothetical protein Hore_00200 [Halothermothrix orenii H 168]